MAKCMRKGEVVIRVSETKVIEYLNKGWALSHKKLWKETGRKTKE